MIAVKNIRHLVEPEDFSIEEIEQLVSQALDIEQHMEKYQTACQGKIMASLFFEPSTRTKFSFDTAMLRLGGKLLGFSDPDTSSAKKGESLVDTIRVMSSYVDIIVMRHPKEGAPKLASEHSGVPIINAGDGGHMHPTQTLTDLVTIKKYFGSISGHSVGFFGDLKYGRTVHSLIRTLVRFGSKEFFLVSPEELKLPEFLKQQLLAQGCVLHETTDMEDVLSKVDIAYMTRVQKERFFNEADYLRLKDSFILRASKLANAKENMIVMHPLPRVNEIARDVDSTKHAVYFKQAEMGVYIRMALIMKLLGITVE